MEKMLELKNLQKYFATQKAVDDISFNIQKGSIFGLLGPNGAGKTTTIKILVGLARPTSGTATIAGADCVTDARKIKRQRYLTWKTIVPTASPLHTAWQIFWPLLYMT